MATYETRGKKIRVKIELQGVTSSATFDSKTEARKWATEREAAILAGVRGVLPDESFGALLARYRDSLDKTLRRSDWLRLNRIINDATDKLVLTPLRALDSTHVAAWRDDRLKHVAPASVRREWNTLSAACRVAIKEWKWLKHNPFHEVSRPPPPAGRYRRPTADELTAIRHVSGYTDEGSLTTSTARVAAAFLFACESAMRMGEICNIYPRDLHLHEKYLKVTGVDLKGKRVAGALKNQAALRNVSLTAEAVRILEQLLRDTVPEKPLFRLSSTQVADALWREKIVGKALIENLHFHDSRHEGITKLAQKLAILDLAITVGVKDLKTLQIYYNPTPKEIGDRLG
jgi:integrase